VELNEEEKNSLDKFKANIDQIYQSVFSKNKNMSDSSLATYKSRVLTVLNDYERYGKEPTKMLNWTRKGRIRTPGTKKKSNTEKGYVGKEVAITEDQSGFNAFNFPGGVRLLIPKNHRMDRILIDGGLKEVKDSIELFSRKHGLLGDNFNNEEIDNEETSNETKTTDV
jgi:hypothetical protein